MKRNEYTFRFSYVCKGTMSAAADSIDEAVEKISEAVQELLPDNADPFSLEIGDLIEQEPVCAGIDTM